MPEVLVDKLSTVVEIVVVVEAAQMLLLLSIVCILMRIYCNLYIPPF